jgi:serpin B
MTYAGARGATAAEMAAVLHLPDDQAAVHAANAGLMAEFAPDEGTTHVLRVANRLWGQQGYVLRPEFLETVKAQYGGGYAALDFAGATEAARRTINDWVAANTEDKIQDLLQPGTVDGDTRLVLTNAVYFHGLWQNAFDPQETEDAPFFTADGREVETPFMRQTAQFAYGWAEGLSVLQLPYEGEELACWILLPDAPDGLAALEEDLDAETLDGWLETATTWRVRVSLPRFTMTSQFELGRILAGLGMGAAFSDRADFSGITAARDLSISEVVHKAYVDVFEEGTEAAAATAVVMKETSVEIPRPPVEFRADHPFLFLIRHEGTGAVLFMGRLADPS